MGRWKFGSRTWPRRAISVLVGLAFVASAAVALPVSSATAEVTVPAADLLDLSFSSGSPIDYAKGAAVTTVGKPTISQDSSLGRKVAGFDGVDDAYQVPLTSVYTSIRTTNAFTLECVFQITGSTYKRLCSDLDSAGFGMILDGSSTSLQFAVHNGAYRIATGTLPTSGWVDAVGVWDGTNAVLYLNGVKAATVAAAAPLKAPGTATQVLSVGADTKTGGSTESYSSAAFAQVRIFSDALSSDEVAALSAKSLFEPSHPLPAADLLDFNVESGTPTDYGAGATVTTLGAPKVGADGILRRKVATFDGVDDAYQIPFSSAYTTINAKTAVTLECVFRLTGTTYGRLCSDLNSAGLGIILTSPTTVQFAVHNGSYQLLTATLPDTQWVDAVGVWDGTTATLYLNGEAAASAAVGGTITVPSTSAANMTIGADASSSGAESYSTASVFAARAYSQALSADQIAESYRTWVDSLPADVADMTASTPSSGDHLTATTTFAVTFSNSENVSGLTYTLDGRSIELGDTIGAGMSAGSHSIVIVGTDPYGATLSWTIDFTSASIPTGGGQKISQGEGRVTLSAIATSPDGDDVTTTFKEATTNTAATGTQGSFTEIPSSLNFEDTSAVAISAEQTEDGTISSHSDAVHDAMPYQRFDVNVPKGSTKAEVRWAGVVDPERTVSLYVWDLGQEQWAEIDSSRGASTGNTSVSETVSKSKIDDDVVHVLVVGSDPFADDLAARDATAGTSEAKDSFVDPEDYDFSFAHWTDQQFLAEGATGGSTSYLGASYYKSLTGVQTEAEQAVFAKAYSGTAQWLIDNQSKRKIAYAAFTGDLIQNDTGDDSYDEQATKEFNFVGDLFAKFDGTGLVNQVLAGNHDNASGTETSATDRFATTFPAAEWYTKSSSWPSGSSYHAWDETTNTDGTTDTAGVDNQNSYVLFSAGGQDFVAVALSYSVSQEEIDWANEVFKKYSDRNGILITHNYLTTSSSEDGRDAAHNSGDGKNLYEQVVVPNQNVFLVLGGHMHGVGTNVVRTVGSTEDTKHNVVELLADYQAYSAPASEVFTAENCPSCETITTPDSNGNTGIDVDGDGIADHSPTDRMMVASSFFRLLQFNVAHSTMSVDTYSPFLDKFGATQYETGSLNYNGAEDNFTVPVDLMSRTTSFQTDGVTVLTPSDTVIGSDTAESGWPATVSWTGLKVGHIYGWTATSASTTGGTVEQFGGTFTATAAGADNTAPVLTVPTDTSLEVGATFDPLSGVSAVDDTGGDLTAAITVNGAVNPNKAGTYTLIYSVADANGNTAVAQRTVTVTEATQTVKAELIHTTLTAPNQVAVYGKSFTLSAKVRPTTATGTVSFTNGDQLLCTATVQDGSASCLTSVVRWRKPGAAAVLAQYQGDSTHSVSSDALRLTIKKVASAISIKVNSTAVTTQKRATVTITVTDRSGITPTGKVRLAVSGQKTKSYVLKHGTVTVKLPRFSWTGRKTLQASYQGNSYLTSSSKQRAFRVRLK